MDANEGYVRAKWKSVNWGASNYERTEFGVVVYDDEEGIQFKASTQAQAWQAAREFTEQRLEDIRQIDAEIELIGNCLPSMGYVMKGGDWIREHCEWQRILSRLQSIRAELTRGLREQATTQASNGGAQ